MNKATDLKQYLIFVLGYDLLKEKLYNLDAYLECDTAFEICESVYKQFIESGYNDNYAYSDYENLQRFVEDTGFDWEIKF